MSTALKVGTAQISSKKLSNASASKLGVTKTDNSQLITENGKRYANPNADPSLLNAESLAHISSKFGADALSKLPKGYGASATENEGTGGTLPNPQQQPLAGLQMPSTDPNQTGQVSYQDAQKALATGGLTGSALAAAQDNLKNKYSTALSAANASGTAAPQDAGEARTGVAQYTPPAAPDTSVADAAIADHGGVQGILDNIAKIYSAQSQTTTLMQDFKKLQKSSGLDEINEEIIDADTIINGTEDDIRNEVQAAGGLGTDSQIQAMALSRNKGLLKRYNQLVQMKTDATNQLNTMSQLNAQDKQMAQTKVQNQISAMFQMATFQQQADNNIREQARWLTTTMGADGLYDAYKSDPRQLGMLEKTLGLAPGGLKTTAQQAAQERAQKKRLEDAQIANIYSEIDARNPAPGQVDEKTLGKIQSSNEYKTINGLLPAVQAIKAYEDAIDKYGTYEVINGTGKGELASTYGNAIAAWKTLAGLGALSGADFELAENAVPAPGLFTRSSTSKSKLNTSLDNAVKQAQNLTKRLTTTYPTAQPLLGSQLDDILVVSNPEKYKVGPDGQVYEITN